MTINVAYLVRILTLEDGVITDTRDEYSIEQLGGTIPNIGDMIISPWVRNGDDRQSPSAREVYVVKRRYFRPRELKESTDYVYVELLVEIREASEAERSLLF